MNGENFTDSERFETPKMNCMLKLYKDKEFYQLYRFVDFENTGERGTLMSY